MEKQCKYVAQKDAPTYITSFNWFLYAAVEFFYNLYLSWQNLPALTFNGRNPFLPGLCAF